MGALSRPMSHRRPPRHLAHGRCPSCTAHLAQLQDALQGGPHQAGLGLQQSLRILQPPHELQRLRPTLPAGVDQACGKRAVRASAREPGGSTHMRPGPGFDAKACLQAPPFPWSTTSTPTPARGPLTVSRLSGGQVGGGTTVDDGVRSQMGELGQGCHQGRGVWAEESTRPCHCHQSESRSAPYGGRPAQQARGRHQGLAQGRRR